jgi:hypothetical protein
MPSNVLQHPSLEFVFGTHPIKKPRFPAKKKIRIDLKRVKRCYMRRINYGDKIKISVYHGQIEE